MKHSEYKILFVDDDPILHRFLQAVLAKWNIRYCLSAEEALEIMEQEKISIVVTDINLPGENGLWLLRQVKKQYGMVQVIVITVSLDISNLLRAFRMGADNFLLKPVEKATLEEAFENSIAKMKHWNDILKVLFERRKALRDQRKDDDE